jgi:outer membrane receptor for ferrienterochelin and colicin
MVAPLYAAPPSPLQGFKFQDIVELSLERLLDITISIAAGKAQKLEEAPGIVSVITAEEIQRLGARTLADVLKTVPGFEVLTDTLGRDRIVARGVISSSTGGSSENVLILFNGHRLNEEINGGATFINLTLPMVHVKRVEIIRGPGSALFGANAFLAVINIVTASADDIDGVEVSAGGGSYATQEYYVRAGRRFGDLGLAGFVQYTDTQGPQLLLSADAQAVRDQQLARFGVPPSSRTPGRTRDDRRSIEADGQATYKGLTVNGRIRAEHSGGFIGPQNNLGDTELDTRQFLFDVSYRYALGQRGSVMSKFSFTQSEFSTLFDTFPPGFTLPLPDGRIIALPQGAILDFDSSSRRFGGEVILDYEVFKRNYFTLGISLEHESTFGLQTRANVDLVSALPLPGLQRVPTNFTGGGGRDIFSVFVQNIWYLVPTVSVTLGVRYDHYSDFGDTVDPRVGLVWHFAPDFYAKLLYGSAFRAPSFFELSAGIPALNFRGNPDLQPSTLQTAEAALGYTHEQWSVGVNYFYTRIRNYLILTNPSSTIDLAQPVTFINGPDIDVQGIELEARVRFLEHIGFVNYTYQHPEERGTRARLPNVPAHLANLGLTAQFGKHVSVTPALLIRGSRPRLAADPRRDVPAYALMNVTLIAKNFWRTLELSGTLYNLFDVDYVDPAGLNTVPGDYPRPGRSVFVKATYKF